MWRESALQSMRRLKRLGLDRVDVLLTPGHLWPNGETVAAARNLKSTMGGEGLSIDSLSLPALDFNLGSCLPEVRSLSVETYRRVVELSAVLGGRGVGVVPGRVSSLLPPERHDSLGWLQDSLAKLAEAASSYDQCLFVETHPHTPVPSCDELAAFLGTFEEDRVKIAYDVATAVFTGENYIDMIGRHGRRIGQIHLSDSTTKAWKHDALGAGDLDVATAVEAIRTSEFEGVTILEIITPEADLAIGQSLDVLASHGVSA
jgi:L-ribulose-5-phosphate 3-epimerase